MNELRKCMAFMACMIGDCGACPYRGIESDRMFACQHGLYNDIDQMMRMKKCDWIAKKGEED